MKENLKKQTKGEIGQQINTCKWWLNENWMSWRNSSSLKSGVNGIVQSVHIHLSFHTVSYKNMTMYPYIRRKAHTRSETRARVMFQSFGKTFSHQISHSHKQSAIIQTAFDPTRSGLVPRAAKIKSIEEPELWAMQESYFSQNNQGRFIFGPRR